ncbi:MAG: ArgE/DapE family deacylase [Planctomycetota bacterium]|nr:ArgE/DapE family deacylase [Planctomycetota bacterium]MDA1138723.1 ArgE/DapE family deacylase [Planctomycetota bacterium]
MSVVPLLQDLVSIRSTNPMGREFSGHDYTEAAMADYVDAYLRKLGADIERQEVKPDRPNVIGRFEFHADAPWLMYEAHMDTVLVEGMTIDPFDPVIKDGLMYGRGSCDTKASMASMLVAISRLVENADRPRLNLMFLAAMDEEFQFSGISHAVQNGVTADFAVCGEPTELNLVIAHKGAARWRIRTGGLSTHSSKCDDGINALYRMAKVLNAIEKYHATKMRPRKGHPLVGGPTVSVGRIEGGQTVNTVPDWACIELDRRTLPEETAEDARAEIIDYLANHPDIDFEVKHDEGFNMFGGMEISPDCTLVQAARSACESVTGSTEILGVPYGADAGKMVAAGIPTIVFGPGNILQAHSADEFVEVAQVETAVHIHEAIAHHLAERI